MGSVEKPRISKATLDKKADSSLVSILKKSFEQLEQENLELKLTVSALRQENKELNNEMERIGKEARKLAFLVDKLKQAIETEERKA